MVTNFTSYGIPLDGIWSDIEYLDSYKTFSLSKASDYWKINSTLTKWRLKGVHWVPTLIPWFLEDSSWNLYNELLYEAGAVSMDV